MHARIMLRLAVLVSKVDSRRADWGDSTGGEEIWIDIGRTVVADWMGASDPPEWRDDDEY